jgi:hypothetical protein
MLIRCKTWEDAQAAIHAVSQHLRQSRFRADLDLKWTGRRYLVVISTVRLLTPKGYCGNHAGPCRLTGRKHYSRSFLEGLDWVSFDDMLNDALDSINHDGDVKSSLCLIRKGKCRRMDYFGQDGGEFDYSGDQYEDWCGKQAPPSEYHWGTPGIIGWRKECVEAPHEEALS